MSSDTGVERLGDSLEGRRVVLGVSGGIAAVDTVRLARELRRHGADVLTVMSEAAQRIITPLAVQWATDGAVLTDWSSGMNQLDDVDGVLVAPATRNTL
ncbi:MAG: flavoprotein, partial [Candidatus Thermoplasmatota archaeon]|nr:flavoprotein [Candidatus Thermoplasmatota archaeon]